MLVLAWLRLTAILKCWLPLVAESVSSHESSWLNALIRVCLKSYKGKRKKGGGDYVHVWDGSLRWGNGDLLDVFLLLFTKRDCVVKLTVVVGDGCVKVDETSF